MIGRKILMSQIFNKYNKMIPVTKIKVEPNFVVQMKNLEKDGYKSVQLGVGEKRKAKKPQLENSKKVGLSFSPTILHEFKFDGDLKPGEKLEVDQVFRKGSLVNVSGVSKGKGFAGVVKRWGFAGGPRTHGQSDRERAAGSIGATTTPGRVYKGMKMAGHMGNKQVTVEGLEIVELNKDENEILVAGSVPGAVGSVVFIQKSEKKKKAYQEPEIPRTPVISGKEEKETEGPKESLAEGITEEPKSDHSAPQPALGEEETTLESEGDSGK